MSRLLCDLRRKFVVLNHGSIAAAEGEDLAVFKLTTGEMLGAGQNKIEKAICISYSIICFL